MEMNKDFREFIESLNGHGVEYLVVGGYAVGYHGHPRFTQDLDVWVKPSVANAEKVLSSLSAFGFPSGELSINDFTNPNTVFQMGNPPFRVDIMNSVDGLKFEPCYKRRVSAKLDGVEMPILSRNDLVRNKKAIGRKKDLADVDHLKRGK